MLQRLEGGALLLVGPALSTPPHPPPIHSPSSPLLLLLLQGSKSLRLTRKASLVAAAATLPRSLEDVKEGAVLAGYVASVTGDAVFVRWATAEVGVERLAMALLFGLLAMHGGWVCFGLLAMRSLVVGPASAPLQCIHWWLGPASALVEFCWRAAIRACASTLPLPLSLSPNSGPPLY